MRRQLGSLVILAASVLVAGCFTHTGRLDRLADELDDQLPQARFEPDHGFKFGRLSLGLAKSVTRLAIDDEEFGEFEGFRGLKRVEVATYETVGEISDDLPDELELSLRRTGWNTLARFREHDSRGWVLYRTDKHETLRTLFVCFLDDSELTMFRLSGRLDKLLTAAMQLARSEMAEFAEDDWDEPSKRAGWID